MSNHTDQFVLDTLRQEIETATKTKDTLKYDSDTLEEELEVTEITPDEKSKILEMAKIISQGLENATYEDKRHILDILDVQATLFWNDNRRVIVKCDIPAYDSVIELHPSRG
jgi:hypothetical protein